MFAEKVLLVVEDDLGLQKQLKWSLKNDYQVLFASNRNEAQQVFQEYQPAVVLHDLGLPPDEQGVTEGKASISSILRSKPTCKVIVMTGRGDETDAIDLIGSGAHDFFTKPVDMATLRLIIERAFFVSDLESRAIKPSDKKDSDKFLLPGLIGQSGIMQQIARQIEKIAKTNATTFIQGESGTGKELVARAIHSLSNRKDQPFIAINCAAIPESLLESELFGYEKGAFTGAQKTTMGKIEQANSGTLFLDEIGDMVYDLQSKILRFLQERTIQRVGGKKDIPVDVRIVSATHQDLRNMIENNQFRQDLYFRINEIEVKLPPLSERGDDILLIARELLEKFSKVHDKTGMSFTDDALTTIKNSTWEGNIRQLSNQINKAVILSDGFYIGAEDLGLNDRISSSGQRLSNNTVTHIPTLKQAKEDMELDLVIKSLNVTDKNVAETAKQLGISRQRVYELIRKHQIEM
jgi:two-component system NtrC family response regulator